MATRTLHTDIEIDATPDHVWQVIAGFDRYPEWNPFITRIEGQVRVGDRLKVRIAPPGGRAMTFKPTVLQAAPGRELRWLGRFLVRGLFDGEHSLRMEALPGNRTRFIQEERFSGVLVGPFGKTLEKTQQGFVEMNHALKERAEAQRTGSHGDPA
jgi:hypothetical protein